MPLYSVVTVEGIGWDDLVIDAMCAHYRLDRLVMALPKAYKSGKKTEEKKKGGAKKTADKQATEQATGN